MSDHAATRADADRATAELLADVGAEVPEDVRGLLALAWLTGYNAGIDYCNGVLDQAGVR